MMAESTMKTLCTVIWLPALLLLAACEPQKAQGQGEPDAAQAGPPANVDLPPLIKLEGKIPPETHADHTMRVDGLLARRDKYLGQKIVVRGYLVEKYVKPEGAERFEHPHAWLADTPAGGDKRLMLVGFDERVRDALEMGQQYVVTGQFDRRSGDGFIQSAGLLVYEQIEGLELPPEEKPKRRRR